MTEYFLEEVLAGQTADVRQYLLTSSIPDRFCAPLCDVLCDSGVEAGPPEIDGRGFIAWLQENNLFADSPGLGRPLVPLPPSLSEPLAWPAEAPMQSRGDRCVPCPGE